MVTFSSENCDRWLDGWERGASQARDDYKKAVQEMDLDAEFNEIACISDFKMLTFASETSILKRVVLA